MSPSKFELRISNDGLNSANTCRQAPHGITGSFECETIANKSNEVTPADNADPIATRSAHIVNPKEMFSTLQPANACPSAASNAAPTANPEYGAWAWLRTDRARSISCSRF